MYIFVSGFGHSGTTLIASILGAHSQVHLIPYETRWFMKQKTFYDIESYAHNIKESHIVEKTPSHVHKIRGISKAFPDAKFVICIRHPLDVIASQYKRHGNLDKAIQRFVKDFHAISNIKHIDNVCVVRYENIVDNAKYEIERICDEVGLLFEAEMLNFYKKKPMLVDVNAEYTDGVGEEKHLKRRAWQVRQPIFDGRGRWRGELSDDQVAYVLKTVNPMMKKLNYTT
jgi:protein O-GlcNAc transferase